VLTCTAASLAAGKKATFIIATVVSKNAIPGNRLVNTASVSSQMYDTKLSNNSYTQTTLIAKTHR